MKALISKIQKKLYKTPKKIRIGWFSFAGCEGDTIVMTEILNDEWQNWKRLFDIRSARQLQSKNVLDEMDIAFIEGAILSQEHADKLKEIRKLSKKVVAVGSCAVTGLPAGQRNNFTEEQKKSVEFLVARFNGLPKVLKVADVVTVDANVPGCPIDPKMFLDAVNGLLVEFGVK